MSITALTLDRFLRCHEAEAHAVSSKSRNSYKLVQPPNVDWRTKAMFSRLLVFSVLASASFTSVLSESGSSENLTTSSVRSISQILTSLAGSTSTSSSGSTSLETISASTSTQNISGLAPAPSENPIPVIFPSTDPLHPPAVQDETIIPDFAPAWSTAYQKARIKIANYTLQELVSVTTGIAALGTHGRCIGNIPSINGSDGWAGLCLQDGPLGVRFTDFVTAFPSGINTAATFNRSLIRRRGLFVGSEHAGKGVNLALGPVMNIVRAAEAGRNFETFGADPFLSGEAAYETILGMQQGGVQACAKHFINNEQETDRTNSSSDVDDRTQHEIYAHPFLRSVMAGVASVLCSYNMINNTYACQNNNTLNNILKGEFAFQGYVVSDWGATHSTLSAVAGLDMTMPGTDDSGLGSYFGDTLIEYVENGTISMSRVTDMATRIFASWYFLHQDSPSYPAVNFNIYDPFDDATNEHVDVQDDHYTIVREIGAASTVLLKNVGGALPLKKPRTLLLAGSDAGPGKSGPNEFFDQKGDDGILGMGWGSGASYYPYLVSPLDAIQRRSRQDHTLVSWTLDDYDLPGAGNMSIGVQAALVFVNADSGEGTDRTNLTTWHGGEDLILAVAAQNNNTIVITHSVGPLIIESWIDHPNVTAVLWAGVSGQETGNAITDVLYGDFNPSGRLPYTIAKRLEDYPAQIITDSLSIPYTEGLEVDYRAFDARNITPRFEFGFGMSYTTFSYDNLRISEVKNNDDEQIDLIRNWEAGGSSPNEVGASTALWLHRPAFEVSFEVQNTGDVAGGEIPQLYLQMPQSAGEPPSILKGFNDVFLEAGETKSVTIYLSRYSLSIWDVTTQGWRRPEGSIGVVIGASSRDERLRSLIDL